MKTFIKITILLFALTFAGCWNMYNDALDDLAEEYKYFLAVINNYGSPDGQVATFTINSDNKANESSKKTATDNLNYPTYAASHPTGKYIYVPNHSGHLGVTGAVSSNLSMFIVNDNGSLNPLGTPNTINTGMGPYAVKVHPSGNYVYVTNDGSNYISMYQVNNDGTLTSNGTIATGACPKGLAIDPAGNYLYAANYNGHSISMYSITDGQLTALSSSPLDIGAVNYPRDIIVHPNNNYAYASIELGYIFIFRIDSGGALVSLGSFTIPDNGNPYQLAIHPTGQYLYVANYYHVDAYSINTADGNLSFLSRIDDTLTSQINGSIGGSNCGIAIDPFGKYIYSSAWGSNVVSFIPLLGDGKFDLINYKGYENDSELTDGAPVGLLIIRKKIK